MKMHEISTNAIHLASLAGAIERALSEAEWIRHLPGIPHVIDDLEAGLSVALGRTADQIKEGAA